MHVTLTLQSLQRLEASQLLSMFARNSFSPRQQCRLPYSPWAVSRLPHSFPAQQRILLYTKNTDTLGAHVAQTMHFFALRGGAVKFSSSVYHTSPLWPCCFCNQEVDITNTHDCFSFSFRSLCLVSTLTHSYYSPLQIWCIYLHGK